ncbi:hypothetical protein H633G_06814 [Metarhizium anisopliae BRIP 53284]|nr:hypothetical protein H633G_06814 [Metarhizium anisopliae BRIP 53284]
MGRDLLGTSPLFYRVLEECEDVLRSLPDGPEWSLIDELSKDASNSRVGKAAVSQPLCTAVQLGLVALFQKSGLRLDVIVGHSSGEIAAAHASSVIGIATAMQIAYYRGKHAHLARGPSGEPGSMMAVGISYDEARMFCQQPEYQGRIGVAAVNAPKSVTLSGDLDAIEQAKAHFDDVQVFARQLKVDTAYLIIWRNAQQHIWSL